MNSKLNHLAIIMDGNRRWAKTHNLPSVEGHREGYATLKRIGNAALERGIEFVSVFAFSTENWKRSKHEVSFLMDLMKFALETELSFFVDRGIRVNIVGDRTGIPSHLKGLFDNAEERTATGTAGQLNLCFNYGGRAEILAGVQAAIASGLSPDQITEERFSSLLWTKDLPQPDLIIRTSGEQRLSGFLTWLGVYSELMFFDKHWPEFTEEDLDLAIEAYSHRQRRFGA